MNRGEAAIAGTAQKPTSGGQGIRCQFRRVDKVIESDVRKLTLDIAVCHIARP